MATNSGAASRRGPSHGQSSLGSSLEPLACVACRARKLKCDRTKPACGRCLRAPDGAVCTYPESRRRPLVKRRNVQDLEVRLAQVEGLLKHGSSADRKRTASGRASSAGPLAQYTLASNCAGTSLFSIITEANDSAASSLSYDEDDDDDDDDDDESEYSSALVDLGITESAPPGEVIEALHLAYFADQHIFLPIVHRVRYLNAYHAGPHMRPTMGLQYAIWAMAARAHPTYAGFHDAFYRRARQYLERDEMKGSGEHFITIGHAQAWALIAAYEARRMLFTRAAMSCSRCVRLVGMMGLSRLDNGQEGDRISATLFPPADWTELEERRRVYWGAFCVDSHASISTGWPAIINAAEATTHLPSSEEAFNDGVEETSCSLDNVFSGSPYSTFSSAIIVCHLFNSILRHVQRKPGDRSEDFDNGPFWRRHRNLDTKLTSAFVFLPDRYRLPANFDNSVVVHTNLNLHAAVICLHNAALERAETHNMPEAVLQQMVDRLLVAAHEIINIMKRTSHVAGSYRSPLASLSLYCAMSVFIYQAMQDEKHQTRDADANKATAQNIELIMRCMDNGRSNSVARLLLHQAILDIDRNGLAPSQHFSWFKTYSRRAVDTGHFVPVLARSPVSRHSWQQPPMAGRRPMISSHNRSVMKNQHSSINASSSGRSQSQAEAKGNEVVYKRRRVQPQDDGDASATSSRSSSADVASLDTALSPRYGGAFVMPDRIAVSSVQETMPSAPGKLPGVYASQGAVSRPQPPRSEVPSMFSHIQIPDPWTGLPSSLRHPYFGANPAADTFSAMPSLPPVSTSYPDNASLSAVQQVNLELSLDPTHLLDAVGGGSTDHCITAWTSFLHADDSDVSGWGPE